jgi:hypothetical protein
MNLEGTANSVHVNVGWYNTTGLRVTACYCRGKDFENVTVWGLAFEVGIVVRGYRDKYPDALITDVECETVENTKLVLRRKF